MAKRSYGKKSKAGSLLMGLSVGMLLVGLASGAIYAIEQNSVSASEKVEDKTDTVVNNDKALEEKIAELEALQAKYSAIVKEKAELQQTIIDNEATIGSLNGRIEILNTEISTLREEISDLRDNPGSSYDEGRIFELEMELEEKLSIIGELESYKDELLDTVKTLSARVAELEEQLSNAGSSSTSGYTLTLENPTIEISEYELLLYHMDMSTYTMLWDSFGAVTSLDAEGNTVPYSIIVSQVENHLDNVTDVTLYYFNGSSEAGDYATQHIRMLKRNANINVKGVSLDNYDYSVAGYNSIAFDDFVLESISDNLSLGSISSVTIMDFTHVPVEGEPGGCPMPIETVLTADSGTFTFEENHLYGIQVDYTVSGQGMELPAQNYYYLSGESGLYQAFNSEINMNDIFISSSMTESGDYQMIFDGSNTGLDSNIVLTISHEVLGDWLKTRNFDLLIRGMTAYTVNGESLELIDIGSSHAYYNEYITVRRYVVSTPNGELNIEWVENNIARAYTAWLNAQ